MLVNWQFSMEFSQMKVLPAQNQTILGTYFRTH